MWIFIGIVIYLLCVWAAIEQWRKDFGDVKLFHFIIIILILWTIGAFVFFVDKIGIILYKLSNFKIFKKTIIKGKKEK